MLKSLIVANGRCRKVGADDVRAADNIPFLAIFLHACFGNMSRAWFGCVITDALHLQVTSDHFDRIGMLFGKVDV